MNDIGVIPLLVEPLSSRRGYKGSMHIEVSFDEKDTVMNSEFWPRGVRLTGWRFAHGHNHRKHFTHYNRNWKFAY